MRKHPALSLVSAFIIVFFICEFSYAQPPEFKKSSVEVKEVQKDLEYLSSDKLSGRETGTEGIELAARYIENHFTGIGLKPFFKTYRDSFAIGNNAAYNIVGLLEGTDMDLKKEYIIIGAHYDHIGMGKALNGDKIANGANDNAAGTVGVMHLAKQMTIDKSNKRSILFVLFSGEEKGLKGSYHLAEKLKRMDLNLYVMLNLEMIGVPMKAKDYMAYITGYENSDLAHKFNEYTGEKLLGFLPQASQMNLFKRSDNYPFFKEFKVPSQTICTFDFSNYPYYHHVKDEAELLDPAHMSELIEKLVPGIQKMANTKDKEIKMTE